MPQNNMKRKKQRNYKLGKNKSITNSEENICKEMGSRGHHRKPTASLAYAY